MTTTQELMEKIRQTPGMYLAPPSAKTLRAFLLGYELGVLGSDSEFHRFSTDFGNWLCKRYHLYTSQHWTKIIEFHSSTDVEEMDLFWKLYDEFEAKSKRTRTRTKASSGRTATVQP